MAALKQIKMELPRDPASSLLSSLRRIKSRDLNRCLYSIPCFTALHRYCIFHHPVSSKSIGIIFPTGLHVSVSHFGNSPNISSFFIIVMFVTVIFDVAIANAYNSLKAQKAVSIF